VVILALPGPLVVAHRRAPAPPTAAGGAARHTVLVEEVAVLHVVRALHRLLLLLLLLLRGAADLTEVRRPARVRGRARLEHMHGWWVQRGRSGRRGARELRERRRNLLEVRIPELDARCQSAEAHGAVCENGARS
jgi:hypothetical protein